MYLALPTWTLQSTLVVLSGVGMRRTMLLALSLGEKLALSCIVYSTLLLPTSSTIGWTLNGKLTFDVERYRISSNSPSGGMKLIVRSESNFPSLTHW